MWGWGTYSASLDNWREAASLTGQDVNEGPGEPPEEGEEEPEEEWYGEEDSGV